MVNGRILSEKEVAVIEADILKDVRKHLGDDSITVENIKEWSPADTTAVPGELHIVHVKVFVNVVLRK